MKSAFYTPGRYACKVISQALGQASTGNPQFVMRFTVLGLVDPTDPGSFITGLAQYERTFYRVITEKTIDYFVEDLKTLGFEGSSFKELDPSSPSHHSFVGNDVDMWCKVEPSQDGGTQEKWSIAQIGGFDVKPLEAKKVRELDDLFGRQLKTLKSDKPKAQGAPQPAVAVANSRSAADDLGITDDDIPPF